MLCDVMQWLRRTSNFGYHFCWCTILTARKLLEPLSTIIQNTGAKSLQYECIHTVTLALPFTKREDGSDSKNAPAVVKLCSDYLRVRTVRMVMLPILVFALTLKSDLDSYFC